MLFKTHLHIYTLNYTPYEILEPRKHKIDLIWLNIKIPVVLEEI